VSVSVVLGAHFLHIINLSWIYDNFAQLITASILLSTLLSAYLYGRSMSMKTGLAPGGNTGNVLYDFFIGHELNPRIFNGKFDLKYFCELRPGLIGWVIIDWAMFFKQYELHGFYSNSMILVCLFQSWYVIDGLMSEKSILTTMDITSDGFGFMLAFGDLAWVPFVYSLQARFLVDHPNNISLAFVFVIICFKLVGYSIFRGSNGQKDTFRSDPTHPSVRSLKFIQTKQGSKLICSSWWGMARHINYMGDLVMSLSWCLPCGFGHIVPYFYSIYFAILLVHRERRDDHKCHLKYGGDWELYCNTVKWRIVPFVY